MTETKNNKSVYSNSFLLRSTLTNKQGNNIDYYYSERLFNIRFLRNVGQNATIYSSEHKMHFIDNSALASVYEIELVDCLIDTSKRLTKAKELIRKMSYRYDWIQVRVNNQGKVISIENEEELKMRWERLKKAIWKDYKGDTVDYAISQIDEQFANNRMIDSMRQYTHFGLLFPSVPLKDQPERSFNRTIEFSEYEKVKFEEVIEYDEERENNKLYNVKWNLLPDNNLTITRSSSSISMKSKDIFPQDIKMEIEFEKDNIINQWSFELLRY